MPNQPFRNRTPCLGINLISLRQECMIQAKNYTIQVFPIFNTEFKASSYKQNSRTTNEIISLAVTCTSIICISQGRQEFEKKIKITNLWKLFRRTNRITNQFSFHGNESQNIESFSSNTLIVMNKKLKKKKQVVTGQRLHVYL